MYPGQPTSRIGCEKLALNAKRLGAPAPDEDMLATALRLRKEELSLREIASRLVIRTGKKRGQQPAPATVMRMLREHDEQTATPPLEPTA